MECNYFDCPRTAIRGYCSEHAALRAALKHDVRRAYFWSGVALGTFAGLILGYWIGIN